MLKDLWEKMKGSQSEKSSGSCRCITWESFSTPGTSCQMTNTYSASSQRILFILWKTYFTQNFHRRTKCSKCTPLYIQCKKLKSVTIEYFNVTIFTLNNIYKLLIVGWIMATQRHQVLILEHVNVIYFENQSLQM